jgi:CBS domain-containing protein
VQTCQPDDTLRTAARIMCESDRGCVPVVDEWNRVVGMLTDRDICVAAYRHNQPLAELRVASVMATRIFACAPGESLGKAEAIMRDHQVRRLPVVSPVGELLGLLSLTDIAREADRERGQPVREVTWTEVGYTLLSVTRTCAPAPDVESGG